MKTADGETCQSILSSSHLSQRLRQLELKLKKAEFKKQLLAIEIQLEKVRSKERSSRNSLLSRNETLVENISRWKRSFPEQSQSQGTPDDMNNFHNNHENQNCGENNEDLHQLVKNCMTLENFGVIATPTDRRKSEEERSALEKMEKSITKVGNHYEVCLPYGEFDVMPTNEAVAYQRLRCIRRKVSNIKMETQHNQKIQEYVRRRNNLWFLPHFPVFNPKKPGKLRLVFDAAVKCEYKNLNDFSLTGPELVSMVFEVLCRFRRHEITFSGDIAEMFHQVKIAEDDCWLQRFLWRNMEYDMPPQVCRILLQTFWKNGIGWDDELKTNLYEDWKSWTIFIMEHDAPKTAEDCSALDK
jgi:hypothetical protein